MPNTDTVPTHDSPLEICILAGDVNGIMDLVDAMDAAEKAASRPAVEQLAFKRWAMRQGRDKAQTNRLFRAMDLARFMCSSEHPLSDYWMHIGVEDIATFKQRYQPAPSQQPIEKQLRGEHNWHYPHHIHRAVIAGLVDRPQSEEYVDALFFGDLRAESNVILKHVEADAGLAPHLLQLFEREGTSDGSFAAREKYCHDPELHWSYAFMALCERGTYTRAQLLDKTLGALACDWPQLKSGWFSRFHEILAPKVDEMAPFVQRYLALCHSRIAPTVSLAMDAVALLYKVGKVADGPLCEAMQPVISSAVKGRVVSALDLLGQVVKRSPQHGSTVSAIAVHALGHTAADVQKKTLAALQSWGMDAATQALARGYVPYVAAVNQASLVALVGGPAPAPISMALALAAPSGILSPLDPGRALQPLTQIPDLVERMAYVLENPDDVNAWERVAEALVRMAPIPATDRAAFLALKKRAKRFDWHTKPLGFALARLMACAVDGEDTSADALHLRPDADVTSAHFIAWRTHSLIAQARTGAGLPPLSAPTHRGGFIDPRQLAARIATYAEAGVGIAAAERTFAQMRAVPSATGQPLAAFEWHVTSSDPSEGGYVCHTLHVVANPQSQPLHDQDFAALLFAKHLAGGRWGTEHDAAHIRFAASLQPVDLEPFFAEAATALGNNLDWWEAQWQNRAYLDVLLEPTTAMAPMACLALGLALAGKEPGQTALAVDVLVSSVQDGRLDITAMGNLLARLWTTPLVKGPRYGKSLAAAAQADAAMPAPVFSLLCAMVAVQPEAPRKDLGPLLELLLELKLAHHLALPTPTGMALAAMRLSGKSKLAALGILG